MVRRKKNSKNNNKNSNLLAPARTWKKFGAGVALGLILGAGALLSTPQALQTYLPGQATTSLRTLTTWVHDLQRHSQPWLQHLQDWLAHDSAQTQLPTPHTGARSSDFAACSDQFPQQQPLHVSSISQQWAPLALCTDAFAVLYSGYSKTPLVVVERLNRTRLQQAATIERSDQFYADPRIPAPLRAELSDYRGSGFDRGHLAAAANQPTAKAMQASFALSNIVPQDPTHNRQPWAKLEADTRKYVQRAAGDVFVYTGVLHEGPRLTIGPNGVHVPSHLFKLVYDAHTQRAWAHVLPNQANARVGRPLDYPSFVQRTQWHLLAGLPVRGVD